MELRQLDHFLAVVEEQHFTRAARRCNVSQSALSASIRSLERDLDASLFIRTTRHVRPTDAGQALVEGARAVLQAVAAALDAVGATRNRLGGTLSVGGIQTAGVLDQAGLLARFHHQHPHVELNYSTGTSPDLLHAIRSSNLDVAFISVPAGRNQGVEIKRLASYPMMLVCRPDHRLASYPVVDIEALGGETFVGGPPRSVADDSMLRFYREAGTEGNVTLKVDDVGSMLDFVANGLGVALLPGYLVRPPLVAVPLSDAEMMWTVGVATGPADKRTRAAQALLDMVESNKVL